MASASQTSVLVSSAAAEALSDLARRSGVSRDAAVRGLLTRFVERQLATVDDHRLTHISTAVNYPQCLATRALAPARHRLTFRAPREVTLEAGALTYRVPGHARRQAHRDYASRPLTDALLTALALEQPFTEDGLGGLPDVLRWREADGLWKLTVAATLTETERRIRDHGAPDLVAMLQDAEIVWHSPWRAQIALHLARRLFTGPDAAENRLWVGEQRATFNTWLESVSDPRVIFGGHELTDGAPRVQASAEGRAATAVWRCRREIALEALSARFAAGLHGGVGVMQPPGWTLKQPEGWRAFLVYVAQPLQGGLLSLVEQGAVLHLPAGRAAALWPLTPAGRPIPGMEQVIAGARQLHIRPIEIAEALLVTHNDQDEEPGRLADGDLSAPRSEAPTPETPYHLSRYPIMDARVALDAGLIHSDECERIVRDAHEDTQRDIRDVMERVTRGKFPMGPYADEDLARLRQAQGNPRAFARVAADLDLRFWVRPPTWTWEIRSVSELFEADATADQIALRGREWCRHVRLALERDMQRAWNEAMWDVIDARADDPDVEVWYSP